MFGVFIISQANMTASLAYHDIANALKCPGSGSPGNNRSDVDVDVGVDVASGASVTTTCISAAMAVIVAFTAFSGVSVKVFWHGSFAVVFRRFHLYTFRQR